jgi:predicted DCC family thiol-disulfide oxidoreductase YuxK
MATASQPGRLPAPDDHPQADVLIYDGQCRMCRAQVGRIAKFDGQARVAFLSLHDPRVHERYPDLEHEAMMQQMVLVDGQGRRHWGAAAVRYLSRRLPALWLLAPVMHVPGSLPVWQAMYRFVARHRYLLGRTATCDDGACRIP